MKKLIAFLKEEDGLELTEYAVAGGIIVIGTVIAISALGAKISGACGRLMCCLRYEYDVYNEELKKTPRVDSIVETPDGDGVIIETVPLAGLVNSFFMIGVVMA